MTVHTTRTAVTLCLAIAMMVQPMLAFGAVAPCMNADCGQETLTCSGCGCCEIEQAGDKCCCCSGSDTADLKGTSTSPAESNDSRIEAAAAELAHIHRVCHCGVSSQPMNHDGQRNELNRELAPRVVLVEHEAFADFHLQWTRPSGVDSRPGSRADFSQRILCVWRI